MRLKPLKKFVPQFLGVLSKKEFEPARKSWIATFRSSVGRLNANIFWKFDLFTNFWLILGRFSTQAKFSIFFCYTLGCNIFSNFKKSLFLEFEIFQGKIKIFERLYLQNRKR